MENEIQTQIDKLRAVAGMLNEFLWYESVSEETKLLIISQLKSVDVPVDEGWKDDID